MIWTPRRSRSRRAQPQSARGDRDRHGIHLKSGWVAVAAGALQELPTPRLRYVVLTARRTGSREELGGRFIYEDDVTAADREMAQEFDTDMVSSVDERDPWALDLEPLTLRPPAVPALGPDDLVVYARAGEDDPSGQAWRWEWPLDGMRLVGAACVATALSLRGLTPPGLRAAFVRTVSEVVDVKLVAEEGALDEIDRLREQLVPRIDSMLPERRIEIAVGVFPDEDIRLLGGGNPWWAAYRAGPPRWLES